LGTLLLLPLLLSEPDALRALRWRLHQLANRVKHHPELGVVPFLEGGELPGSAFAWSICRSRTKARMISMFTCAARLLRKTLVSIATPCSVKA
jgi:hypothetical protein